MSNDPLKWFDEQAQFTEQDWAKIADGKAGLGKHRKKQSERKIEIAALQAEFNSQPGQIWRIVNQRTQMEHWAVCADSTTRDPWQLWYDGGWAIGGIFTSPPYLEQRAYQAQKDASIKSWADSQPWYLLMSGVFESFFQFAKGHEQVLVNLGPVYRERRMLRYWNNWLDYMEEELKWPLMAEYIWDKLYPFPGRYYGKLATRHEYIFHLGMEGREPNKIVPSKNAGKLGKGGKYGPELKGTTYGHGDWTQATGTIAEFKLGESVFKYAAQETIDLFMRLEDFKMAVPQSVFEAAVPGGFREKDVGAKIAALHPARYPVAVPEYFIGSWADNDCWIDPFAGSFTNLLACERLGVVALMMESDPGYFAVGLKRAELEGFTVSYYDKLSEYNGWKEGQK